MYLPLLSGCDPFCFGTKRSKPYLICNKEVKGLEKFESHFGCGQLSLLMTAVVCFHYHHLRDEGQDIRFFCQACLIFIMSVSRYHYTLFKSSFLGFGSGRMVGIMTGDTIKEAMVVWKRSEVLCS